MNIFNFELPTSEQSLKEFFVFAETKAVTTNIGKEFLISLFIEDDNILSALCEKGITPGEDLQKVALTDILTINGHPYFENVYFKEYVPSKPHTASLTPYEQSLSRIVATKSYPDLLSQLLLHYQQFGGSSMAKYIAFSYTPKQQLVGISHPDNISLDQLYCIDSQKQSLINNTVAFLHGRPANNVLLYGNSGCGKSSMVKALLNNYHQDGLRLVQIAKEHLADLPALIDLLKHRSFYYIIFLDDLSFENDDYDYKALKTILEGGIEKQPENILFYATSNRFHLVNETWAERQGDDVHVSDTKNEKLSLSERFGIRISFFSPDQKEYLKMVEEILQNRGIPFTEDIQASALQWALFYNGRSGRTAMQFANTITQNDAP